MPSLSLLGARPSGPARSGPPGIPGATWKLPGPGHGLGLWHAADPTGMGAILASLPLSLDERGEHAAHAPSERPGAHRPLTMGSVMSEQDRKVAIITGGSQGIGAGLVAEYRRRGWAVVATSRTIKPDGDPAVLTVDGDISEAATADRIISGALGHFGRIDTLVNNAGVYISKPFTDYTADDYGLWSASISPDSSR